MKALVLAAGLGTRLRPLTDQLPKALVPVDGKPMLQWTIEKLIRAGVDEIIINVHYLAGQVEEFIRHHKDFGIRIVFSDERKQILDTGGAIRKASWFFDDHQPFFVYNTDVLSSIDLGELYRYHKERGNLATLAVKSRPTGRNLLIDKNDQLVGWRDNRSGEEKWVKSRIENVIPVGYSGIQVINPSVFPRIIEEGAFPLIPLYLRLAEQAVIGAFRHDEDAWYDIGSLQGLEKAEEAVKSDMRLRIG